MQATLRFQFAQDFDAAWHSFLKTGQCFLPNSETPPVGTPFVIELSVADLPTTMLAATVTGEDVDAFGALGVIVAFDEESRVELKTMAETVSGYSQPPPEATMVSMTGLNRPAADAVPALQLSQPAPAPAPSEPPPARRTSTIEMQVERLPAGTVLEGRFQIESWLASGGMGDVYRATHVFLKRPIALKLLRRELAQNPDMWARFQREAELVSRLESPNIVRVFDFGKTGDGQPFLAMELVEGSTLDAVLEEHAQLPVERAVALVRQVCDGLAEAHALNIVHRDLKPANIILGKKRDGSEAAKILDFGIARTADSATVNASLTQMGAIIGTPAYLSPEQALAGHIDQRSDIYSLGCVLFELLTGRPPFLAPHLQQLVAMHISEPPPMVENILPGLAEFPLLGQAIERALAKSPDERFQNVNDFAKALAEALEPMQTVVPEDASASAIDAAWGADTSPAAPPIAQGAPVVQPAADVDSFFGGEPSTAPASGAAAPVKPTVKPGTPGARLAEAYARLSVGLPPADAEQLVERRQELTEEFTGTALFIEILGAQPRTLQHATAVFHLTRQTLAHRGFVDDVDDDGATLLFPHAAGDAVRAAFAIRDEFETLAQASPGTPVRFRGAITSGTMTSVKDTPVDGQALKRARMLSSKAGASSIFIALSTANPLGDLIECKASAADAETLELIGWRSPLLAPPYKLLGRDGVLQALEKRITAHGAAVTSPVMVVGAHGAGRTAIAAELAMRAKHHSFIVGSASASASMRHLPYGAIGEMICALCGVRPELRRAQLPAALEALNPSADVRQAAMSITGLTSGAHLFTPRQAASILRAVVAAGAGTSNRRAVLFFDDLDLVDAESQNAIRELMTWNARTDLTIAFADEATAAAKFGQVQQVVLPPLTDDDLAQFAQVQLNGQTVGATLIKALHAEKVDQPGQVIAALSMFSAAGRLRIIDGAWGVHAADGDENDKTLAERRFAMLRPKDRLILRLATLCGDAFDPALLKKTLDAPIDNAWQRLVVARLVRPLGGRLWAVASDAIRQLTETQVTVPAFAAVRLVAAITEHQVPVAPDVMARLQVGAGDVMAAIAAWKGFAEDSVKRLCAGDLGQALKGWADTLAGLTDPARAADVARARIELLSRAVSCALQLNDAGRARTLLDEAAQLAQQAQQAPAELLLASAKICRAEARRAKATELLEKAFSISAESPVLGLCCLERGDARETEGDVPAAIQSFVQAVQVSDATQAIAPWHAEWNFRARAETRLGNALLAQKNAEQAKPVLQSALARWKASGLHAAEARVSANLGALCVSTGALDEALLAFREAAAAAGRAGDTLLQARQLMHMAKVLKRAGRTPDARRAASAAKTVSATIGWDEGVAQAEALANAP